MSSEFRAVFESVEPLWSSDGSNFDAGMANRVHCEIRPLDEDLPLLTEFHLPSEPQSQISESLNLSLQLSMANTDISSEYETQRRGYSNCDVHLSMINNTMIVPSGDTIIESCRSGTLMPTSKASEVPSSMVQVKRRNPLLSRLSDECRTRTNKVTPKGNNKHGRKGFLRCRECRDKRSKVASFGSLYLNLLVRLFESPFTVRPMRTTKYETTMY